MCNTRISNFRWPVVLIAICALSACGESSDGDGDGILLEGLPGETTEGSLDDQMNSDNIEGENDGEGQIETGSENETETDIEDGAGNETENETEIEEAIKRAQEALEEGKASNFNAAQMQKLEAAARFAHAQKIAKSKAR